MDLNETLNRVDELIRERSILNHPFYQAWTAGELSGEQLRRYSELYYPHVASFAGYLENAIARADDPEARGELESNLSEELSEPKPHEELWLDFAEGVGADRQAVAAAPASPATSATVETFDTLTSGTTAEAVAALYAYESQQPEVSETKSAGLRKLYGVTAASALGYFEVHSEADVRHRAGERRVLAQCLERGATEAEVLAATSSALDAYWGLLDGVCRETGLPLEN